MSSQRQISTDFAFSCDELLTFNDHLSRYQLSSYRSWKWLQFPFNFEMQFAKQAFQPLKTIQELLYSILFCRSVFCGPELCSNLAACQLGGVVCRERVPRVHPVLRTQGRLHRLYVHLRRQLCAHVPQLQTLLHVLRHGSQKTSIITYLLWPEIMTSVDVGCIVWSKRLS